MTQKIQYKKELFDFVNDLTAIHNSIAFERVKDRVVVRKSNANQTLPYILSVPAEYFDIEETVAFYKYDNFHKFLSSVKDPDLAIDMPNIIISKSGKTPISIDYRLSDEEGIINGPKDVIFDNWNAIFTLSSEDLSEIVKINGYVKGSNAKISVDDDEVTISIFSNGNDNSFEKTFTCERNGGKDSFDFIINANRFEVIPTKNDYIMKISEESFINISLIHDEIEFNLYSGEDS